MKFFLFCCYSIITYCRCIYFRDKESLKSHKTVQIKVFLNFFLLVDGRNGSGAGVKIIMDPGSQQLTDPEPEQWKILSHATVFAILFLVDVEPFFAMPVSDQKSFS
jgi:hypothetical protein